MRGQKGEYFLKIVNKERYQKLFDHPEELRKIIAYAKRLMQYEKCFDYSFRDNCMKMLRAKLMEMKAQQHAEKISDIKGVQMKIEWGSQIRSYVFMPYQLVKDTRTGYETSQIDNVMDGDLDGFLNAYLTQLATGELKK